MDKKSEEELLGQLSRLEHAHAQSTGEAGEEVRDLIDGKDVVLRFGKYRGRKARIRHSFMSDGTILCEIGIYRRDTRHSDPYLWGNNDTRRYYMIKEFEFSTQG